MQNDPEKLESNRRDQPPWNEMLLIVLLFFVFAGGEPPGVNESHYLTKAKHYWNPDWCAGDFFLDAADAHLVFYWTVGWLTRFLSLTTTAWVLRLVTWCWLAFTWWRMSRTVVSQWGSGLLAAAIALTGWHWGHLSGEWVVGGAEAKGFAFGFVFLALADVADGKWTRPWVWLGLASAFHVLVGGWSVVALSLAWALEAKTPENRLARIGPWIIAGGALSLPGLIPTAALVMQGDPAAVREAGIAYVYERLPHHLVFHRFSWLRVMTHLFTIGLWLAMWRAVRDHAPLGRLNRVVLGTVIIATVGVVVDRLSWHDRGLSAALLRFYWFRMTDALVPCGLALSTAQFHGTGQPANDRSTARSALLITCLIAAMICVGQVFFARRADPRPEALWQGDRTGLGLTSGDRYGDWRDACQWIRESTPTDALILGPGNLQTLRWYADRGEVCTWKDIPQDVTGILEWRRRRRLIRETGLYHPSSGMIDQDALVRLVESVRFGFVVLACNQPLDSDLFRLRYRNRTLTIYEQVP